MPLPAADEELRSLRTSFEASEARRTAADQRADNAVAYAQQLQAQLTQVTADLEGRLQAAETRTRTVANEAQDWQIRHREAQAQIAELAMSLAGAEERLAAVRDERDDLMTQLEQATDPSRDEVAAELDA
jgi:chromosome segregation ATPase